MSIFCPTTYNFIFQSCRYICKYFVKTQTRALSLLSLLHDAKCHIDEYPSVASDSGTPLRNTVHLLQRFMNSIHAKEEYSASQAVGALLGFAAEHHLHPSVPLFAKTLVMHAMTSVHAHTSGSDTESESAASHAQASGSDTESESAASFGSSGYGSQEEADLDAILDATFNPPTKRDETESAAPIQLTKAERKEFGDFHCEVEEPPEDGTMENENWQRQVSNLTSERASVPIAVKDGKYTPVYQHEDWLHKPDGYNLHLYSLYEFTGCFQRKKSTDRDKERLNPEAHDEPADEDQEDDAEDAQEAMPAPAQRATRRRAIARFPLADSHPLSKSHHLQLRAHQALPIIMGKIPPFPGPRRNTRPWLNSARRFSAWALTVFRPWDTATHPGDLSWAAFVQWIRDLQKKNNVVCRTRLAFVTNAAHGMRCNYKVAPILKTWRFREATRWDELPKDKQPRAYRFSRDDDDDLVFSRQTRHQAELGLQALLNLAAGPSSQDKITMSMLQATVANVDRIFATPSHGASPLPITTGIRTSLTFPYRIYLRRTCAQPYPSADRRHVSLFSRRRRKGS